jgi:DNA-binding NarL/FixJ family response regulator
MTPTPYNQALIAVIGMYLTAGLTYEQIAPKVCLSPGAVRNYASEIYRRNGIQAPHCRTKLLHQARIGDVK